MNRPLHVSRGHAFTLSTVTWQVFQKSSRMCLEYIQHLELFAYQRGLQWQWPSVSCYWGMLGHAGPARPDLMKETDIKGTFHSTAKGGTSYLLPASASGGRAWPAAWQWGCCRSSTPCTSADERGNKPKKKQPTINQKEQTKRAVSNYRACWLTLPFFVLFFAFLISPRSWTHSEVEALGLLLIGPPLADVGLAHVGVRRGRLDRLGGLAVLEGLRHVKVLHSQHVLEGLHRRIQSLLHLHTDKRKKKSTVNLFFWGIFETSCFISSSSKSSLSQKRAAGGINNPARPHGIFTALWLTRRKQQSNELPGVELSHMKH